MIKIILTAVVLTLTSCASAPQKPETDRIKTGAPVIAPHGYSDLCKREPNVPECAGKK